MGKSSKSLFIGAIASALMSGAAYSADLIPPPVVEFEPEYEIGGNLYLRGYVGFTNQEVDELDPSRLGTFTELEILHARFESGGLFGGAIGYRVNNWFRADISAEYRMRTAFDGLDRYNEDADPDWEGTNQYTADKSEFLVMANAFIDLGTYHGITPYIGAGAGASYTMIHDLTDTNVTATPTNVAYADSNGEWSFAWALHAGLGYEVNERLTLDFGYRYLHIGDAESGDVEPWSAPGSPDTPVLFNDLTSHDFTLGFRWNFGEFGHAGYGGGGYGHLTY